MTDELTTQPICPYCNHVERDAWEIDIPGLDGDTEKTCGHCGKDYFLTRRVYVYYITKPLATEHQRNDQP